MDLGPYEGIPGISAPFVRPRHANSGYFLDVDVDVVPAPRVPSSPIPRDPALPDSHQVFNRGLRLHQTTLQPFTYTTLDTIHEDLGTTHLVRKKRTVPHDHIYRSRVELVTEQGRTRMEVVTEPVNRGKRPRGRLLAAPHINPDPVNDVPSSKPPPPPQRLANFAKETVIPATRTFTSEKLIPGVKSGAKVTKYNTLKGARITKYKTFKGAKLAKYNIFKGSRITKQKTVEGARLTKEKTVEGARATKEKTKEGAKLTKQKTAEFTEFAKPRIERGMATTSGKIKKIFYRIKKRHHRDELWFDYRDYEMSGGSDPEPESIPDIIEVDLEIPEFKPRPGQTSRAFRTPIFDKMARKEENMSPGAGVQDDISLGGSIRADSPPLRLHSPSSARSSPTSPPISGRNTPATAMLESQSLHSSAMQEACTIEKLKLEIQRLQKTLSDKEDLVLASRRIASDKLRVQEKKLKAELSEVTEKYTEIMHEKTLLSNELAELKSSSVSKEEHQKLFTQYTKTEALVFELQSKLVNCAATVPLEEYRMLQRELEESTDEVIHFKDLAEKKQTELEAVILSQADRLKALKDEHARQLTDGQKLNQKEIEDRDSKLKLLKEQITSALDEKSIARQEQLKELSRELEHTTQENRILHKNIQELSSKLQNCENCVKLKTQMKAIQDGKRLVDMNILKPIKEKGKMK